MAIFPGREIDRNGSQDLGDRSHLSTNLQVADASLFNPQNSLTDAPIQAPYTHVLSVPLSNKWESIIVPSTTSGVFNQGIHFTIFEIITINSSIRRG